MYRRNVRFVTALSVVVLILGLLVVSGCKKRDEAPKAPAPTTKKTPSTPTAATKAQTACPIVGTKIDKSVYADYQGKRVYFCCTDCKTKFNAEPAKYVKQLEDKGITLEETPK